MAELSYPVSYNGRTISHDFYSNVVDAIKDSAQDDINFKNFDHCAYNDAFRIKFYNSFVSLGLQRTHGKLEGHEGARISFSGAEVDIRAIKSELEKRIDGLEPCNSAAEFRFAVTYKGKDLSEDLYSNVVDAIKGSTRGDMKFLDINSQGYSDAFIVQYQGKRVYLGLQEIPGKVGGNQGAKIAFSGTEDNIDLVKSELLRRIEDIQLV